MFALFRENVKIASGSIKSQKLRTALTVFIIAIGITALVGILGLVSALENTISSDFSSMGANTFNIQRYEFTAQRSGRGQDKVNPIISYTNVKDFEEQFSYPGSKTSVSFFGTNSAEVKFENKKTDPEVSVLGINEHFINNSGLEIEDGRQLNFFDIDNNNNVCVIGSDLKKAILDDVNPVGKVISVRGNKFTVVGVLKSKGATFGNNQDFRVLIPLQKARSIFTSPNINYAINVKVEKKEMLEGAQDEAIAVFRNIRGLTPLDDNNFGLERSDDLINRVGSITDYLYVASVIISAITIFGSTIALMNIMLVSVTERTREIGVRKALGAKRKTIAQQFLMETLMISQIGGLTGIILGTLMAMGIALGFDLQFGLPWTAIIWAVSVTFIVAIISGLFPAIKASKLDPIESLRYE
ncbi:FtsX-like permease family protein [Paucihalobacter ruber]|uniref:FtsX-like permease family protein n=1 Tax=Paucihalobacter ruber TaxID=2567861 RepID=A0A506PJE6_9FLAO|nr:ABC transporter permease [Paucihalobacter ruber]TPV33749.1 FtsX-like permease family protein [Paucihalobacter ruber]